MRSDFTLADAREAHVAARGCIWLMSCGCGCARLLSGCVDVTVGLMRPQREINAVPLCVHVDGAWEKPQI
jgi:hypothetical protein